MPNYIETIETHLKKHGLQITGETIETANHTFYSFIQVSFDKKGKRTPSAYLLSQVSKHFKSGGITVRFILINDERRDLDSSLKTALFTQVPELIRNSYLSISDEKNDAIVWIDSKTSLDATQKENITDIANEFLSFFSFRKIYVQFTQAENTPTPTAILRAVKIQAPCDVKSIQFFLESRFSVPNEKWLLHSLDKLRKSGHLLRLKTEKYVLSLKGLAAVGTTRNKKSPDVSRALAVAQRTK